MVPRRLFATVVSTVLLGMLTLSGPAAHATGPEITRFYIDANLDARGRLTVENTIDMQLDASTAIIDLWLPTRYSYGLGTDELVKYSHIAVTSTTGASTNLKLTWHARAIQLSVGDPGKPVSGLQTYVLSYQATGLVQKADQFYKQQYFLWYPIGPDWNMPISNVQLMFTLPNPTSDGMRKNALSAASLLPNESWSVQYRFAKDRFTGGFVRIVPTNPTIFGVATGERPAIWVAALLVVAAVVALRAIKRAGRSQRVVPGSAVIPVWRAIPSFGSLPPAGVRQVARAEPPPGLQPYFAAALERGRPMKRDVGSMVVGLATRGYLRVVSEEGDTAFEVTGHGPGGLSPHERQVFDWLSARGKRLTRQQLTERNWPAVVATLLGALDKDLREAWLNSPGIIVRYQMFGASFTLVGTALVLLVSNALLPSGNGGWGWLTLPIVVFGLGLILVAPMAPVHNPVWPGIVRQCRDFSSFLRFPDLSQLDLTNGEDVFSKYLPYAVAFGCAGQWAKSFDELAEKGVAVPRPAWFAGRAGFRSMTTAITNWW